MREAVAVRAARPEELDDAAALRSVMAREMGRAWDDEFPGWRQRFARYFREKQGRGDAQFFVAEADSRIVGMAVFSVSDEYRVVAFGQPRGYVNSVFVVPELRRRGIARDLMVAGIAWLRERGCVMVRLRTSREGRPLYESLGFAEGTEMELAL